MRMYDLIVKKRDGGELTREEIDYIIEGYTDGDIPDYQMSAWLMAVFYKGMNARETADMTMAMVRSGDMLDLSAINGIKADKHSTGGVGDKVTLVLAPMVAAAGVPVAKMSGRGLGHTGGTIDKLESIPGFNTSLTEDTFVKQVNSIKIALTGQTGNLTPADKKIYALRDATGIVDSIPLIASSIMSKKIAAGAQVIVLDVTCGSGAFMHNIEDARKLARLMVDIGDNVGRRTIAVITDMDEPLGNTVGNAMEVIEAVETLKGRGSRDVLDVCLELGAWMIAGIEADMADTGKAVDRQMLEQLHDKAYERLETTIKDGSALDKFREWITAQNGNSAVIDDYSLFPSSKYIYDVKADRTGYIRYTRADEAGMASMVLGGGRAKKDDAVNPAVGVEICAKTGDYVHQGDVIARIHSDDEQMTAESEKRLKNAFVIEDNEVERNMLIKEIVF